MKHLTPLARSLALLAVSSVMATVAHAQNPESGPRFARASAIADYLRHVDRDGVTPAREALSLSNATLATIGSDRLTTAEQDDNDRPRTDDDLHWNIAAYLIPPWIKVNTAKGPVGKYVSLDPVDILEDLRAAYMVAADVRKGRWGFAFDSLYFDLKDTKSVGPLDVRVKLQEGMVQFGPFYRVVNDARIQADVLLTARYVKVQVDIDVGPGSGRLKETWWDMAIGFRTRIFIDENKKWSAGFMADVSGFGLGAGSNLTYQILVRANYHWSRRTTFTAGWRYLDFDYDHGGFYFQERVTGPLFGVVFSF